MDCFGGPAFDFPDGLASVVLGSVSGSCSCSGSGSGSGWIISQECPAAEEPETSSVQFSTYCYYCTSLFSLRPMLFAHTFLRRLNLRSLPSRNKSRVKVSSTLHSDLFWCRIPHKG